MWTSHASFHQLVARVWNCNIQGSPSFRVGEKLKRLRARLRYWNWETFGDIRTRLDELKIQIDTAETPTHGANDELAMENLLNLKAEYTKVLEWETDMVRQKTRTKWLEERDRNTRFYHALIRDRRNRNSIILTQPDGSTITDGKELGFMAVNYFRELFTATPHQMDEELFDQYPCGVTDEMNAMLAAIPDEVEVKNAVWSLSPDSAPGPDGFTGNFFQSCWLIVEGDIVEMVKGFFLGDHLDKKISATTLILIPKIEKPKGFTDLRPISLASFTSKIISKIMTVRIAKILPSIIDEDQFGFVKGRSIQESIALAQELTSDLDRKVEAEI